MRKYSQKFDEEDAAEELADSAEQIAHRKRLIDEWNAWRARTKKDLSEQRGHESQAEKSDQDVDDKEEIEVWVEEVIEQIEEEVVE